ncbi:MAG: family 78 glycoside hydrolase catalytic domain [Chloroflexota bacterium]
MVDDFRFEYGAPALGIGVANPRLSWKTITTTENWLQVSYEISVEFSSRETNTTGRIESPESVFVPWAFRPLLSREQAKVHIRLWGNDGVASDWCGPFTVEAGLLSASDWKACFIAASWDHSVEKSGPSPLLRKDFSVVSTIDRARLYITSLGLYEVLLNGEAVGDEIFSPGWSSYGKRLRYQTFDVTGYLVTGTNTLGVQLADGWYRGRLGYNGGRRAIYGDQIALLAQLEVFYADGTSEFIVTDSSWRCRPGPILSSEIYDGETYDATQECPGWATPGFDAGGWPEAVEIEQDLSLLVAPGGPPIRRTTVVSPVAITKSPSGKVLIDFGQNLVGRVKFTVQGRTGEKVVLRHAEVLEDGELGVRPLRTAQQTDRYTLKGGGPETWEPKFTYHGFRYVEVEGWPGTPNLKDFSAIVCHSDMARTGWFSCSDPLINQLHQNIVWSTRGNFFDIPTDCPQRDERLGWTGDIQIFAPTACYLYDCAGFLKSWLTDLALEQRDDGAVPLFIPNINNGPIVPSGAWGDAAVIVPWVLYRSYGDRGILQAQFQSICAWVDYLIGTVGPSRIWSNGFQFGDWLDPNAPPEIPGDSRTDSSLVATAYFAHSAELASKIAGILERPVEQARYTVLAGQIREAFANEFIAPSGRVVSDSATAHALVIQFGLALDAVQRARAGQRLSELVRDAGYRISTGFIGTPLVCDALCETGHSRAALLLLKQRKNPSWLYPVIMGATTMWERWDSMLPSGKINPGDTTSFNHYALGSIADWLHRSLGGLIPLEPGYRRFQIKPLIGGEFTNAESRLMTPYGLAGCRWNLEENRVEMNVTVPPNTTAEVIFPRSERPSVRVGSGSHRWSYEADKEEIPPVTLNSTLSELFANAKAWERIVSEIPDLACLETITQISSTTTINQQLDFLPNGESFKRLLEAALLRWADEE